MSLSKGSFMRNTNCHETPSLATATCKTGPYCTKDTYSNCTINYNCNQTTTPPPPSEDVMAFVNDPNLSYVLTQPGPIQLLAPDTSFRQLGGFTLSSTQIPNDTFNFPSKGIYEVTLQMDYSFLPPTSITIGTFYQVVVAVKSNQPQFIPDLSVNTGIPSSETISDTFTRSFLLDVTDLPATLNLELVSFNFGLSFNNSISFYNIVINAIKLTPLNFN